jgi:hypothetical protein
MYDDISKMDSAIKAAAELEKKVSEKVRDLVDTLANFPEDIDWDRWLAEVKNECALLKEGGIELEAAALRQVEQMMKGESAELKVFPDNSRRWVRNKKTDSGEEVLIEVQERLKVYEQNPDKSLEAMHHEIRALIAKNKKLGNHRAMTELKAEQALTRSYNIIIKSGNYVAERHNGKTTFTKITPKQEPEQEIVTMSKDNNNSNESAAESIIIDSGAQPEAQHEAAKEKEAMSQEAKPVKFGGITKRDVGAFTAGAVTVLVLQWAWKAFSK